MLSDERHHCVRPLYDLRVSEDQGPGYRVTSGLTSHLTSTLTYRLSGNGADKFSINRAGELRLRQFLDRETTAGNSYIDSIQIMSFQITTKCIRSYRRSIELH